MKKTLYLLAASLMALSACSKGMEYTYQEYLGTEYFAQDDASFQYMMLIADGLVTGVLNELELAMDVEARGMSQSTHFTRNRSFYEVGSLWKVKAEDSKFKNMEISCVANRTWNVSFEGDLPMGLDENTYPTRFTLTAQQPEDLAEWGITLKGIRTEREGYSCSFETHVEPVSTRPPYVSYAYTMIDGNRGWNNIVGEYYLTVYKDGEIIDYCSLTFNGSPSRAVFIRGL